MLTDFIVESDAVATLGAVSITLGGENHLCCVVGVGANAEQAALLVKRKLVKAHRADETETNGRNFPEY